MKPIDTLSDQETKEAFMAEFQELLRKYNAEFEVVDTGISYYPERVPQIAFNSIYDEQGNMLRGYSDVNLPDYIH